MLTSLEQTYAGKRVLVTGHTGFKGAWLSHWLGRLGSKVIGYSLAPDEAQERLFTIVNEGGAFAGGGDLRGDLLDSEKLGAVVAEVRPDFVFHLAAQSLVRRSYREPVDTVAVNVLGTARLLEAVRIGAPAATVVAVTTDKCYENKEWAYAYRETDALGGRDPYSASKAAAELIVQSWRSSFFDRDGVIGRISTARAGNVIGGGDFSEDRIVPDLIRSLRSAKPLEVRSPRSTRPWQHVLDCLSGYLWLGRWLTADPGAAGLAVRAFNFGPSSDSERNVADLVETCLRHWPGQWMDLSDPRAPHEAVRLAVSSERARAVLGWSPCWDFEAAVRETMVWYRMESQGATVPELIELMDRQIASFAA